MKTLILCLIPGICFAHPGHAEPGVVGFVLGLMVMLALLAAAATGGRK